MQRWLVLDFETASYCDLKRAGSYRYAADPTTEVLCLAWETDRRKQGLWFPGEPCPFPPEVLSDFMFVAHNAAFERAIWSEIMVAQYGWPEIPLKQWSCTMARALQLALPAGLDNVLKALSLPVEKDMEGNRLTLSMSRPNKKTGRYPERTPEVMARIGAYCLKDVEGQVALHRRIGWLPPAERIIWELSQEVNDRGILIDRDFVIAAQKVVDEASKPLAAEFKEITGYNVGQIQKIKAWVNEQGVPVENLAKATLADLLGSEDEGDETADDEADQEDDAEEHVDLPPHVERALKIRQLIGSSSIKKLKSMRECVGYDGRARGLMVYHGTTPGRQTAKLLQPHNFPRPSIKEDGDFVDAEALVNVIKLGDYRLIEDTYGPAVEVVVSSLRHAICAAPGHEFFSGDYSGIQARTVLALAGQHDKTALMAAGADVYCDMAEQIYKRPITKKDLVERQIGKNSVLGLGFQGGPTMFQTKMAPKESLEFCETVVNAYRKEWAPCVPLLWKGLQWAAIDTVWDSEPHESHGITYFLRDTALVARAPNGSEIHYQYPQKTRRVAPWSIPGEPPILLRGFSYRVMKQGRWITRDAFGGQLTENIVMKIEREIMEAAKQRLRDNGYGLVLEVHDECICEPVEGRDINEFKQIMEAVDPWVKQMQIPIAVDVWQGPRYRK